jgi:2'-5' RNA ligase
MRTLRQAMKREFVEKAHSGIMVCLYLPKDVQNALAIKGGENPDSLHVTLAYLPGIGDDSEAYHDICLCVEEVAKDFARAEGWIGGVGRFNGSEASDGKDVYYASFNCPGLPALHAEVVSAIEEAGYEVSKKHGFTPHVTLKYIEPDEKLPADRKQSDPFRVPEISIVSSKMGRTDVEFAGDRVLKDLPSGSSVHVPTAGSEKKPKKKKSKKEFPVPGNGGDEKPEKPVAPAADAHDTERSRLVDAPLVDNLETEMVKAGLGYGGDTLEAEVPDPATADDAYPPDVQIGIAALSKQLTFSDVFDSIFGELLGAEPDYSSDRVLTIRKLDKMKQVVYCVVTEPHTVDAQEDWMTPDDIEDTAHLYMLKSRIIGKNHEEPISAAPVESYIAPQDLHWEGGPYGPQVVRKGSWVIGIKVFDKAEWRKVENGDYQGVSISGLGERRDI